MLEMFFDNEKVFTIFREILMQGQEEICYPRICYDLGISPKLAAEVLNDFVFLDILKETENTFEDGIFKINLLSPIMLAICKFDEIVNEYTYKKIMEDDEIQDTLKDIINNGDDDDTNVKDFLKHLLEEDGLKNL